MIETYLKIKLFFIALCLGVALLYTVFYFVKHKHF